MSRENIELIRVSYEALGEGDLERLLAGFDPRVELDVSRRLIDPGIYIGHEGLREYLRQLRMVWSNQRIEPEEYIPVDENIIVVPIRIVSTGRGSGIDVDGRAAWVWEIRNGLVVRATAYQSKDEALEAAGLTE